MLKKIIFFMAFSIYVQPIYTQTFDYERAWGTYYGPVGNEFNIPVYWGGFLTDSQNNLHLRGHVQMNNSLGASHYSQYTTPGGQGVTMNVLSNFLQTKFTNSGTLLTSEYTGYASTSSTEENLVHIDKQGNYYYIKTKFGLISDPTTPNTWLPTDPIISTASNISHQLLTKKNSSGNILWKTFLPNTLFSSEIISDENGNIYIYGNTTVQNNIATPGTFRQNFQIKYVNGSLQSNAYIVKLGLQGELLWGSYLPTVTREFSYYNQQLFLLAGSDLDADLPQLATSNTFQTNPAGAYGSLTALSSVTGIRLWGTYLGSPSTNGVTYNIQVNSSGIYLSGIEYFPGSTYYATPGAYKSQATGFTDYYLTKLDFTGNRIWGTYFGSDGMEELNSSNSLALTDHGVFLAGCINGIGSNIATPGAFLDTPPTNNNSSSNFFFAQFDLSGNLQWSSYYGGPQLNLGQQIRMINIAAPDHSAIYLYGATGAATGIATPGALQPQLHSNIGGYSTGFIARFNYKGELSTSEIKPISDLALYDNPNNGNFSLRGQILEKEDTTLRISDASGRMVYHQKLPRNKIVELQLQSILTSGLYFVEVNNKHNKEIKTFKIIVNK